ncbi:MAG: response regulator [Candidatus Gastranaerophilales bacterium]|nr:response regulator [Candidatus Gastranaerophilales bacterium]
MDFIDQNELIYTNEEKCVGCNKCIIECPVHYANIVYLKNGERKIKIDQTKCIQCGRCIKVCDHEVRSYKDDAQRFIDDLKNGVKISIIAAPAIRHNFENYKKLFGYLKNQGANIIYDVSLGAEITVWGYLKAIEKYCLDSVIAQPCPAIVNYIEKYQPDLIEKLAPVHSPALCTAIYLKKYKDVEDKLAFLSPCISKIDEFADKNTDNNVEYNVTFKKIKEYLNKNNINLDDYDEYDFDNIDCGIGLVFSRPGGLAENIRFHKKDIWIKQIEGDKQAYKYLNKYSERIKKGKKIPQIVDVLNCSQGCNLGTGTCRDIDTDDVDFNMNSLKREKANQALFSEQNYPLFEMFDRVLNLDDFIRKYTDKSFEIKLKEPSPEEYEEIFIKLHKLDYGSRKINCFACGYGNCFDMAKSIYNGMNHLESCIYYNRRELEIEHQQIIDKNEEIQLIFNEMKSLNREKEQSEIRIKTILDSLSDGVILVNENEIIELCNPAIEYLFDYQKLELIGQNFEILVSPSLKNYHKLKFVDSKVEIVGYRKNGTSFPLEIGFSEVVFENQTKSIFIMRDISERKEIEKLKNEFVSVVNHELRTPLTSIRGSLGILSSDSIKDIPEKAKEFINIAYNNSVRLINIINDILDMEKIEAGKMDFNMLPLEIMPVINQAILINEPYARQFDVHYVKKDVLPGAKVNIDKDRLLQVITNLLSNATKFSPAHASVEISVYQWNDFIRVAISDKGIGIPEEFKETIFNRFVQVDSSNTRNKGGTGLGLSICKAIIEKMNGSIGFESEVNKGSTFYFNLPLVVEENSDIKTQKEPDEGLSVLLCEYERKTASYISDLLSQKGYHSDIADNAACVKQLLSQNKYDVIILDLILPDQDGISLIRELRLNEKTKKIPIIIISYDVEKESKELNGSFSLVDWINKPVDQEKILNAIKHATVKELDAELKILHIEDDFDITQVVSNILQGIGAVSQAYNIQEAKQKLEQEIFDLIILDLELPDGNGINLLPEIQEFQNNNPSVLIFSAYDVNEEIAKKVNAVLLKSTTSNEKLLNMIKLLVKTKTPEKLD